MKYCYGYRNHFKRKRCIKSCDIYAEQCCFHVPWRDRDTRKDWLFQAQQKKLEAID